MAQTHLMSKTTSKIFRSLLILMLAIFLIFSLAEGGARTFASIFGFNEFQEFARQYWFSWKSVKILPQETPKTHKSVYRLDSEPPTIPKHKRFSSQNLLESGDLFEQLSNGYHHHKTQHVSFHKASHPLTGQVVFDVKYSMDAYGRRSVPAHLSREPKAFHINLVGCSYIFGEGLNDEETLGAHFQTKLPKAQVFNMGRMGGSIVDALIALEDLNVWSHIHPEGGVTFLFHSTKVHLQRFTGSLQTVGQWNQHGAFLYTDPDGKYKYGGTYQTHQPLRTRLSQILAQSSFLKLIQFDWPIASSSRIRDYVNAIRQFKESLKKKYPQSLLVVVLYPDSDDESVFINELEHAGIYYFDYSNLHLNQSAQKPLFIPFDGHPSGEFNRQLAERLVNDIQLASNGNFFSSFFSPRENQTSD